MSLREWDIVPIGSESGPEPVDEREELTVIQSSVDSQVIFLPEDEAQIGREEFIVVSEESLRDVER
jgi:hypothetical protein